MCISSIIILPLSYILIFLKSTCIVLRQRGQNDCWLPTGCTKFFKDFAVTFSHAFKYYITGLIIGYFFCVIFKKCYSAWRSDRGYSRPLGAHSAGNEENHLQEDGHDDHQHDEDGDRQLKKGNSSDCRKLENDSRNLDTLSSVRESHSALDYWRQCFDSFGYVVVDTLNPTAPFRRLPNNGNSNVPHRPPITLRWEPGLDHPRDELQIPKSNKSSSTTDMPNVTPKTVTTYSQVRSGDLKCSNNKDSSVDTRDIENPNPLKRTNPKRRNKKLDTVGLRNVEMDEYDSVTHYKTPKNDVVLAVTKKLSTTGLKNTVKSSLIPGQKVSKNAVIVLRLRDKQLSTCNVFNEEGVSLASRKTLDLGSRSRIKKPSYYRTTTEKRNRRDTLKSRRDSEYVITSDENSSGSFEDHKKSRNLLSFSKFSKNHLHCPFSKKRNWLSDEKCKSQIASKKSFKQSSDMWGRRNPQSQIRHSSKQIRPNKADKSLQSQDFSKRRCFKYKNGSRKRQKIIENPSKPDMRSLSRFFSEFRKSNLSTNKQCTAPIWTKGNALNEEDVYQIEVKESANGLRIRSKSKCRFSENPMVSDKVKKSIGNYHSKDRKHKSEPRASTSRHKIAETSYHPESDEPCHIGKLFGSSTVSIGISNKQASSDHGENPKQVVTASYSNISTGSESISSDELNPPLTKQRTAATGSGKVEELIVAVGDTCNKNGRGQFWKIFGSKNNGKSS